MEVIARKRRSHESVKFSTVDVDALPGGQHSLITGRHDCLVRGVWDMYVVVHQARGVEEVRFGRRRAPSVPPEGCSNLDLDPDTQDSVIAYFTRGAGNLSIDKGEVLHREVPRVRDRKSTRLNSSHVAISYAVFCLKKKKKGMLS